MLCIKTTNGSWTSGRVAGPLCGVFALVCLAWPVVRWLMPSLPPDRLALGDRWILFLSLFPSAALLAAALLNLRRYFGRGEFDRESGSLMRRAGLQMLAAGPLLWVGRLLENNWVAARVPLALNFLVGGLFLVVLGAILCSFARVVEKGKRLEEEVEGFI